MPHCKLSSVLCADADPILAYSAGAEVNQLQWSTTQPDWVAICFANKTQVRPRAGALGGACLCVSHCIRKPLRCYLPGG